MISGYLIGPGTGTNPGLGNQMFAASTVMALAWDNNDEATFSQGPYQDLYADNIFRRLPFKKGSIENPVHYNEPSFTYNEIPYQPNLFLNGYFQSHRYFWKHEDKLKSYYKPPIYYELKLKKNYIKKDTCMGAIHVRRGDFIDLETTHPTLPINYYKRAIDRFPEVDHWIICSDDPEWCKDSFKFLPNKTISENNSDYVDLWLMSLCHHHIIANSTFSWWSAWLCDYSDKKVVAPNAWFGRDIKHSINDLIPHNWVRI